MGKKKETTRLPLLSLKDPEVVVFPGSYCEIEVGRLFSVEAVMVAKNSNNRLVIGYQKNKDTDDPKPEDFHSICCEAEIVSLLPISHNRYQVVVQGVDRARLKVVGLPADSSNFYYGDVEKIEVSSVDVDEEMVEKLRSMRDIILDRIPAISIGNDIPTTSDELSLYYDNIASQLPVNGKTRLSILRIASLQSRANAILKIIAQLGQHEAVERKPEMKGEGSEGSAAAISEVERLQNLIADADLSGEAKKVAESEFKRLQMIPQNSSEFQVAFNYIETLVSLPWSKSTEDKIDIGEARESLSEDHFGLEKVKERILEFLAVRKLAPDNKGSILCFSGPPGTGKTSMGRSIAKAMGRKFIRMSLGGVNDEAEIRGHRRTYVGAMPGKIIQMMRKVESNNPVFMLDEVDKLCRNMRGDPAASLLEVLDPEQNFSFLDNYLGVPFDLSKVMFVATVNDLGAVPPALRDRMEIIDISGYTMFDKLNIAQKHLIRKKKEDNGLKDYDISIEDDAVERVIEEYTSEAGVRSLERYCGTIMRKMAVKVAGEEELPAVVDSDMIPSILGPPKVFAERASEEPLVGVSTGLAWSAGGGSILFVETCLTPGTGKIELTGNLGKVIQESAKAAYTWIKAHAVELGLEIDKIQKQDVHIHFPAGATPKDGPSAGIAVASAMLSSFLNKPVKNTIAMTGEISLRGRVMPIGGLREKIMAANRAGIEQVLYPVKNQCDLEEIPDEIKESMELTPVADLSEALSLLIIDCDGDGGESKEGVGANGSEPLVNLNC